jgi:hypothetical protein
LSEKTNVPAVKTGRNCRITAAKTGVYPCQRMWQIDYLAAARANFFVCCAKSFESAGRTGLLQGLCRPSAEVSGRTGPGRRKVAEWNPICLKSF